MSIPPESIQVGKCYLGDNGRVWRVVSIMPDGRIQFEFRTRSRPDTKVWKPGMLDGSSFAALAQREVPCDWTPEGDG